MSLTTNMDYEHDNAEMDYVFIVYKTDAHHSLKSRDIIGIATDMHNAIELCYEQAKKEGNAITFDQEFNLTNSKQTQGYQGDGEFFLEEVFTDVLL